MTAQNMVQGLCSAKVSLSLTSQHRANVETLTCAFSSPRLVAVNRSPAVLFSLTISTVLLGSMLALRWIGSSGEEPPDIAGGVLVGLLPSFLLKEAVSFSCTVVEGYLD
jgi:hypothetical protein